MSAISNSISKFVMRDHAPTQIALYSLPAVSLLVRLIQRQSCFDILGKSKIEDINIEKFNGQKAKFKKYLTTGIQIQTALAIAGLALYVLFPAPGILSWLSLNAYRAFAVGTASNFLYDRCMNHPRMRKRYVDGSLVLEW